MASLQQTMQGALGQLRDMTVSQKAAIALGVALIAGSMIWLAQWAATPEMTPLIQQPLSTDEIAQITTGLDSMGEKYKVEAGKVFVRSGASTSGLLAQLSQMDKLPSDTSLGFAAMIKASNPWLPQEENNRRWNVALATELEHVLSRFTGVKEAKVFLNLNAKERGFARNTPSATASVTLIMKSGEAVSRQLAIAAAKQVAGAVRGLPLKNVEVVDGSGKPALEWEDESGESMSGLQRLQKQKESETAAKIRQQLAFDPNLRVSVQVVLELSTRTESSATPTEGVPTEENSSETTTSRNRAAGQPGVEPNVGAAVSGGGSDETSKTETRESRLQPGMTTSTTSNPAGTTKQIFAAINVSHSYLLSVYRRQKPDGAEPSEAEIETLFQQQKSKIEAQAAKLVQPPDPKQVAVNWYYDAVTPIVAVEAGAVDVSMGMLQTYGPASLLGVLALASLGMMMKLAKQKQEGESFGLELGLPKEAIEAAQRASEDLRSHAGVAAMRRAAGGGGAAAMTAAGITAIPDEQGNEPPTPPLPVGKAAEAVLEAREVGEGEAQIGRMLEQVADVANQDEEGVAHIIETWMDSDRWH
ncbi:MAG: flagellar M-ring protein FliF C-terminal domain-containing protein [Phycisphaerae bacterium]